MCHGHKFCRVLPHFDHSCHSPTRLPVWWSSPLFFWQIVLEIVIIHTTLQVSNSVLVTLQWAREIRPQQLYIVSKLLVSRLLQINVDLTWLLQQSVVCWIKLITLSHYFRQGGAMRSVWFICHSVSKTTAKVISRLNETRCCDYANQSEEPINFWRWYGPGCRFRITFPLPHYCGIGGVRFRRVTSIFIGLQSPADFHNTRRNEWRRQVKGVLQRTFLTNERLM